jgi:hypothetical protein
MLHFKYIELYDKYCSQIRKTDKILYYSDLFKKKEDSYYCNLLFDIYKYYPATHRIIPLTYKEFLRIYNTFDRIPVDLLSVLDIANIPLPIGTVVASDLVSLTTTDRKSVDIEITHPMIAEEGLFEGTSHIFITDKDKNGLPILLYGNQEFIENENNVIINCKPIWYNVFNWFSNFHNYWDDNTWANILAYIDSEDWDPDIININISNQFEPSEIIIGASLLVLP